MGGGRADENGRGSGLTLDRPFWYTLKAVWDRNALDSARAEDPSGELMQPETWIPPVESEPYVPGSSYDRYHARNPVARAIMHRYLDTAAALVAPLDVQSMMDVGCGEGHFLAHLRSVKPEAHTLGVDLSTQMVSGASERYPDIQFRQESAYHLNAEDSSVDLVVAADLLQHVSDPQRALREISRVARKFVLLSVPREPLWRVLNILRLAYLDEWGNPPGHVHHFRRGDFLNMVRGHVRIMSVQYPTPWVVVLARCSAQ